METKEERRQLSYMIYQHCQLSGPREIERLLEEISYYRDQIGHQIGKTLSELMGRVMALTEANYKLKNRVQQLEANLEKGAASEQRY